MTVFDIQTNDVLTADEIQRRDDDQARFAEREIRRRDDYWEYGQQVARANTAWEDFQENWVEITEFVGVRKPIARSMQMGLFDEVA